MEVPIVVALIAAAVSLVSALVTLYVARKSSQRAVEVISVEDTIKERRDSMRELQEFIVQTELYRIRLWNFDSFLSRMPGGRLGQEYAVALIAQLE